MTWIEQEHSSRRQLPVTTSRAEELNNAKKATHHVIAGEADHGNKTVSPIRFQPVRSPGLFEAEFAQQDSLTDDKQISKDVIFHFWPWGLHVAEKEGKPRPAFKEGFRLRLQQVLCAGYRGPIQIEDDRDMGAIFVRIRGAGGQQFWHPIAVKAVTALHQALGGE
jgi:hypothetical protein